jgi:ankyrin repeat protein
MIVVIVLALMVAILLTLLIKQKIQGEKKKIIKKPTIRYVEKVVLPSIKVFDADEMGNTPLHIACKYNHESITIYCINRAVIECTEPSTTKLLTEFLNKKNCEGNAPLHLAVQNQSLQALEVLLRNRATDINVQNNQGETPLHLAIRCQNLKAIKKLIEKRADISIKDNNGIDAKELAKKFKVKINFDQEKPKIKDNRLK